MPEFFTESLTCSPEKIREAFSNLQEGVMTINHDNGPFTQDYVYDSLPCATSHPRKENINRVPRKSSEPL